MPFGLHLRRRGKSPVATFNASEYEAKENVPAARSAISLLAAGHNIQQSASLDLTASSSSIRTNVGHDRPYRDLWDEAYKALREESQTLVEKYEQSILLDADEQQASSSATLAPVGSLHRQQELTALVSAKVQDFEEKQGFQIAGKQIKVQSATDKVVRFIMFAKDYVSSAVSAEPHAALAWAGVCIFLPLLLNSASQRDAAVCGFEQIPYIVRRCRMIERLRKPSQRNLEIHEIKVRALVIEDLETKMIQLYRKILEYQIRLMCQYSHSWALRFGRDIMKADDWTRMLAEIQTLDSDCSRLSSELGQEALERSLEENNRQIDGLVQSWSNDMQSLQRDVANVSTTLDAHAQKQQFWRLEEEARKCLHILRSKNVYEDQKNRTSKRLPGTCGWFLSNNRFHEWRDKIGSSLLWVSASPGCGKSVLSKSLIEEKLLVSNPDETTVCYFFFKDISAESRSICKAIAAILHQLFTQKPLLAEHAASAYATNGSELPSLFNIMWEVLVETAANPQAGEIVCLLDAVDECEEAQQITLIEKIKAFHNDSVNISTDNVKLKFLLTSRPYRNIGVRFHTLIRQFPTIHLSGDEESDLISEEIEHVMRFQVAAIASERSLDEKTERFLLEQLLQIKNRTYLWLHLVLDQIRNSDRAGTANELRKEIIAIPKSVGSAYEAILGKTRDRYLAARLLHIIVGAERPLTVRELKVAMSMEDKPLSYKDLELESDDAFAARVRNICGLFIYIDRTFVYLIHQTAKDFLVRQPEDPEPTSAIWEHSLKAKESQTILADICVTFLMLDEFAMEIQEWSESTGREEVFQYLERYDFLEYASCYWTTHLSQCEDYLQSSMLKQIVTMLKAPSPRFQTWFRVRRELQSEDEKLPPSTTGLVLASLYGFLPVVEHFLSIGTNIEEQDSYGATPLNRAVSQGSIDIVLLLLQSGADVEASNWDNPWHEEVNDDGSERDVKLFSGGPLWMAASANNHDIIRLLIEYGADVDAVSFGTGTTALGMILALGPLGEDEEAEETIRILLEYGADVNATAMDSEDAVLPMALSVRSRGFVFGRMTSLQLAVLNGRINQVELLLTSGADLNKELSIIKECGSSDAADSDIQKSDRSDEQSSQAHSERSSRYSSNAIHGSEHVPLIEEWERESPKESSDGSENRGDRYVSNEDPPTQGLGQSIRRIEHAIERIGPVPVDEECEADSAAKTSDGSEIGGDKHMSNEDLIAEDWANSIREISKLTVIHIAVSHDDSEILALLLSHSKANQAAPTSTSASHETPHPNTATTTNKPTLLHLAATLGHCNIAAQLLRAGIVDVYARDGEGKTALDKASQHNHHQMRELLLREGAEVGPGV